MDLEKLPFCNQCNAKGLKQESSTDAIARGENLKRNGPFT